MNTETRFRWTGGFSKGNRRYHRARDGDRKTEEKAISERSDRSDFYQPFGQKMKATRLKFCQRASVPGRAPRMSAPPWASGSGSRSRPAVRCFSHPVRMAAGNVVLFTDSENGVDRIGDNRMIVIPGMAQLLAQITFTDQHDADSRHFFENSGQILNGAGVFTLNNDQDLLSVPAARRRRGRSIPAVSVPNSARRVWERRHECREDYRAEPP